MRSWLPFPPPCQELLAVKRSWECSRELAQRVFISLAMSSREKNVPCGLKRFRGIYPLERDRQRQNKRRDRDRERERVFHETPGPLKCVWGAKTLKPHTQVTSGASGSLPPAAEPASGRPGGQRKLSSEQVVFCCVMVRGGPVPPSLRLLPSQDPSWNHRVYRLALTKLSPPIIPFMPLLLKGNWTSAYLLTSTRPFPRLSASVCMSA